MLWRRWLGGPLAFAFLTAGCGVDLPEADVLGNGPLDYANRARLVDVEFIEFVVTERFITTLATRPGDTGLYAVARGGEIMRVEPPTANDVHDGTLESVDLEHVVLDVVDSTLNVGEEGLVGLAFDPTGSLAYINHSRIGDGHSVIAEYAVGVDGLFDPASRRELFVLEQSSANHNGGQLAFGPDGYLYLGVGDGAGFADLERTALDFASPLGKILRIDPRPSGDMAYSVPADNPVLDFDGADPRMWARGLRNPYSFSFDALTGDLWIADVGQGGWEEINYAPAIDGRDAGKGFNFGWSAWEGPDRFNADQSPADHTLARLAYSHESNGGCGAVADGLVVRNAQIADLDGWYVYGDWCTGTIWAHDLLQPAAPSLEIEQLVGFTQMAQTADGNLYVSALRVETARGGSIALVVAA